MTAIGQVTWIPAQVFLLLHLLYSRFVHDHWSYQFWPFLCKGYIGNFMHVKLGPLQFCQSFFLACFHHLPQKNGSKDHIASSIHFGLKCLFHCLLGVIMFNSSFFKGRRSESLIWCVSKFWLCRFGRNLYIFKLLII